MELNSSGQYLNVLRAQTIISRNWISIQRIFTSTHVSSKQTLKKNRSNHPVSVQRLDCHKSCFLSSTIYLRIFRPSSAFTLQPNVCNLCRIAKHVCLFPYPRFCLLFENNTSNILLGEIGFYSEMHYFFFLFLRSSSTNKDIQSSVWR